jgi:hypothetical protein
MLVTMLCLSKAFSAQTCRLSRNGSVAGQRLLSVVGPQLNGTAIGVINNHAHSPRPILRSAKNVRAMFFQFIVRRADIVNDESWPSTATLTPSRRLPVGDS